MWKDAYLESRVLAADPVELISMLYDCGIQTVQDARGYLAEGNIPLRGKAICKAIMVISELHSSLDHSSGGALSLKLASLYEYMKYRLTTANLKKADEPLAEVEGLMRTLSEGWNSVRDNANGVDTVPPNMAFVGQAEVQASANRWSA